jgi:anti-sigma B factor antagonist
MEATKIRSSGDVSIVELKGRVNVAAGDTALRDAIDGLLAEGKARILVDLGGVPFLDTMGLGELIQGRKKALQKGGNLKLLNAPPIVLRALEATGLAKVFETYDHEVRAIESF